MRVSVLCPTRRRVDQFWRSYTSLMQLAEKPQEIEILAAIDPDDAESAENLPAGMWVWTAPERYGYDRLHEYYNELAVKATGDWLLLWNDDAVMETKYWDSVIAGHPLARVLWLTANHHSTGNLFPAWPRAWSQAVGYVSMSPNVDRWMSEIGRALGTEVRIPVTVFHDRADITGNNLDDTYREGRMIMGNADHADFGRSDLVECRRHSAELIAGMLHGTAG